MIEFKKFTDINKVTGGMLFLLPLTLAFIDLKISTVLCVVATVAAAHEGYLVSIGKGCYE